MRASFVVVAGVTAIAIAFAWKISEDKAPTTDLASRPLYPNLIDSLNDVQRVTVRSAEAESVLVRADDEWQMENRDNFPARFADVKSAILQLADLEILEPKTANADNYAQLGVEGVEQEGSSSRLIELADGGGATLAALIVGNERDAVALQERYVRRVDEAQSYLVRGALELDAEPVEWLETELVDVASKRVKRVAVTPYEGDPVIVEKESEDANFFVLQGIPAGYEVRSKATLSSIGGLLQSLKFTDVAASARVKGLAPRAIVEVVTFDGLVATLDQFDHEGKVLLKFDFSFNPDAVVVQEADAAPEVGDEDPDAAAKAMEEDDDDATPADEIEKEMVADEAARLSARVADWVYAIPDYKLRISNKRMEDLIKEIEPEEEEPAAAE